MGIFTPINAHRLLMMRKKQQLMISTYVFVAKTSVAKEVMADLRQKLRVAQELLDYGVVADGPAGVAVASADRNIIYTGITVDLLEALVHALYMACPGQ